MTMESLYANRVVYWTLVIGALFAILVQSMLLSYVIVLPERPVAVRIMACGEFFIQGSAKLHVFLLYDPRPIPTAGLSLARMRV